MRFLIFQLQAPLASWGDTAVGEYRPSRDYPGLSALVGLLGAALGIRRDDEAAHAALRDHYAYTVGIQSAGDLLRDFHTAQVPSQATLKKRAHASRRDELAIPGHDLNTILSTRDYRQGAACVVAVEAGETAGYSLEQLAHALRRPRFTLYLGRKSCPPGAPLFPQVIEAANAESAFETYLDRVRAELAHQSPAPDRPLFEPPPPLTRLAWGVNATVGRAPDLTTTRKDHPLRRKGWMFGDRTEYVALISQEG
ncbi:MAG: type I-E CRISPR-associated protein Cas5/CasD [Methyloversatilis discipulorum]|uniref:type I-E CRISPR-associated protein Cas5/CasD n=1 Tax=Methyloversatilis discipulorum TaxID=1119528 RepID=UPI0026F0DE38|nr:type I-E CRISPR-associated protein Cas5/CasD [Methyloversatilis discipulorum]MBT9517749.1 type I-E CRISPR-associated protein Cas5/CasD [Methyloversatilis discipulorum]